MIDIPIEWFTVEEAAHYLRVSKRTIYKWSNCGKLPVYLIGDHRYRRYKKTDLDNLPRRTDTNIGFHSNEYEVNDGRGRIA